MEHKEAYELIDAYVFGTLNKSECEGVENHLADNCVECNARLIEAGKVSIGLSKGLKQTSPPEHLKLSLMKQVNKTTIVPLPVTPHEKTPLSKIVAIAGAFAVVALSLWNLSLNTRVNDLQNQLASSGAQINTLTADNAVQAEATILLGKPCTRLVDLKGVEPNAQAFAKLFLHPDEDYGVFYAYQLPAAPADREYQVWIKRNGVTESIGIFTVRENGNALLGFHDLPKVPTIDSFIVTIEPIGGAKEPTGMMYLQGSNPLSTLH